MTLLDINLGVDIAEHLEAMMLLASECDVIVEYGVRAGTSTGAWLSQKPKKLTCIDINPDVLAHSGSNYRAYAEENGIDFQVICGNSMAVEPAPCDLLFIDTHHIYEQLIAELRRHGSSARKYIVCHDTTYNAGCWDAVVEYVRDNPDWTVKAHYENNNGLAVLERTGPMSATAKRIQAWYDEKMGPQAVVMFEHFDTLIKYGSMVEHITEFGVHAGASTCCWLMSKPKSYTGYDIDYSNLTLRPLYEAYAKENGTDFQLFCQSSIKEHIEETDLLFIDSNHRPEHVAAELKMQNDKVKRFIILHDTECAACPGLREVVDGFVEGSPDWQIREHFSNCSGLTILERMPRVIKKGSVSMETQEAAIVLRNFVEGKPVNVHEFDAAIAAFPPSHNRTLVLQSSRRQKAGQQDSPEQWNHVKANLYQSYGVIFDECGSLNSGPEHLSVHSFAAGMVHRGVLPRHSCCRLRITRMKTRPDFTTD